MDIPDRCAASPRSAQAPFDARPLTKAELLKREIHLYFSPKLNRPVAVISAAALAMGLQHDFDPDTALYVERPRVLRVGDCDYELSFWTRSHRGREQFFLLTDFAEGLASQRRAAQATRLALASAAQTAQIALTLVPCASFLLQATVSMNRMRLLPYVQSATALPGLATLTERVMELFRVQTRISFTSIEQSLSDFAAADVRAATATLIHGGKLGLDWSQRIHDYTPVERKEGP